MNLLRRACPWHGVNPNLSSVLRAARTHFFLSSTPASPVVRQTNSSHSVLIASFARSQGGLPGIIQILRNTNRQALECGNLPLHIHKTLAPHSFTSCMVRSSLMSARTHISPNMSRSLSVAKKPTQKVSRQNAASHNNHSPIRLPNDSYEYKASRSSSLMIRCGIQPRFVQSIFCSHVYRLLSRML